MTMKDDVDELSRSLATLEAHFWRDRRGDEETVAEIRDGVGAIGHEVEQHLERIDYIEHDELATLTERLKVVDEQVTGLHARLTRTHQFAQGLFEVITGMLKTQVYGPRPEEELTWDDERIVSIAKHIAAKHK